MRNCGSDNSHESSFANSNFVHSNYEVGKQMHRVISDCYWSEKRSAEVLTL